MTNKIYNQEKNKQLGMSFSTASYHLKKNIMFHLAKELKKDICYRCNKPIESVNDFSVEHKKEWLYSENPREVFFDIGNIAFSHNDCNRASRRKNLKINSQSGYKGVVFDDSTTNAKKWRTTVWHDNKKYRIGRFDTPEEAAVAYDYHAKKIIGKDTPTNESLGLLRNRVLCTICNKEKTSHIRYKKCKKCHQISTRKVERPSKEELLKLILTYPFTTIAKQYGVSDNAVRKWCKLYDLPTTKKEIKAYLTEQTFQIIRE